LGVDAVWLPHNLGRIFAGPANAKGFPGIKISLKFPHPRHRGPLLLLSPDVRFSKLVVCPVDNLYFFMTDAEGSADNLICIYK
jgi:hypothetical protein